jgi:hypothetical protein
MEYWSIGVLRSGPIASASPDWDTVRKASGSKRVLPGAFFPLVVNVRAVPGPATAGLVRGVISRVGLVRPRNLREHR